jgi:intein/homing endonuclease
MKLEFDVVNSFLNIDYNKEIDSVILCDSVSGDAEVILEGGIYAKIEDLFKNTTISNLGKEYYIPENKFKVLTLKDGKSFYGDVKYVVRHLCTKQMYRVYLNNLEYLDVTEDHSIITYLNKRVLKNVNSINDRFTMTKPIDVNGKSGIYLKNIPNVDTIYGEIYNEVKYICKNDEFLMECVFTIFGIFIGDGSYTSREYKNYSIFLSLGIDKSDLINKIIKPLVDNNILRVHECSNGYDICLNNYDFIKIFNKCRVIENLKNKKIIPEEFKYLPVKYKIAFCRGYFEADGTVIKKNNSVIIRLTSIHLEYLLNVKYILFTLGISSRIFSESKCNYYKGKCSGTISKNLVILSVSEYINTINFISDRKSELCNNYNSLYYKKNYKNYDFELTKGIKVEKLPVSNNYVYDIEVDDTHMFFANNLLVHNTDSMFIPLPCEIEEDYELTLKYIENLQNDINGKYTDYFLNLHNIKVREYESEPLLPVKFKNEYLIKSLILYAKKRYISVFIEKKLEDGTIVYAIDPKGVEGKRVTNSFVKSIVFDLFDYLEALDKNTKIYDRFDILDKVIIPYINNIYNVDTSNIYEIVSYLSLPVNVNKKLNDLKNVAGYYKGTIIFDAIAAEKYWEGRTGKGKWLCIKLNDESAIPEILNQFAKFPQIKIEKKKTEELVRDITIPDEFLQKESEAVSDLLQYFSINYDYYIELLMKKVKILYNPFDSKFCDNLSKKLTNDLPVNFSIFSDEYVYTNKEKI